MSLSMWPWDADITTWHHAAGLKLWDNITENKNGILSRLSECPYRECNGITASRHLQEPKWNSVKHLVPGYGIPVDTTQVRVCVLLFYYLYKSLHFIDTELKFGVWVAEGQHSPTQVAQHCHQHIQYMEHFTLYLFMATLANIKVAVTLSVL